MKCPYCGYPDDRVIDSRPAEEGAAIRRRRECLSCLQRYTTFERIEQALSYVVKRDGSREAYSREKLTRGILRACEKRPISAEQIEQLVNRVESDPRLSQAREIHSEDIGHLVLAELKRIDPVAYIRFASVYRRFERIDAFLQELQTLVTDSPDNPPSESGQHSL